MMMPEAWRPEHKLFPYQVGFTSPPFDFDAAPSDFLRMCPETVGLHGWMLHVPFVADALSWTVGGDPSTHSWWDGGSFHANLANSTGLAPQPRKYIEIEDAPDRVKQVHRRMKPHYDHLYKHRLTH